MYRRIIVGYDGRDTGRDAATLGLKLAEISGADLLVATVVPSRRHGVGEPLAEPDGVAVDAQDQVVGAIGELSSATVEIRALATSAASPAAGLDRLVDEEGADLLVLGSASHGRLGRLLIGSTAERLLQGGSCAVALAPLGYRGEEQRSLEAIGVGYDGSGEAEDALRAAESLATRAGASLRLITVTELPWMPVAIPAPGLGVSPVSNYDDLARKATEGARARTEGRVAQLARGVRGEAFTVLGDPAEELARESRAGLDLLVCGSRGYGPWKRVLLGGVSIALARTAACPLLVVPRPAVRTRVGHALAGAVAVIDQ